MTRCRATLDVSSLNESEDRTASLPKKNVSAFLEKWFEGVASMKLALSVFALLAASLSVSSASAEESELVMDVSLAAGPNAVQLLQYTRNISVPANSVSLVNRSSWEMTILGSVGSIQVGPATEILADCAVIDGAAMVVITNDVGASQTVGALITCGSELLLLESYSLENGEMAQPETGHAD